MKQQSGSNRLLDAQRSNSMSSSTASLESQEVEAIVSGSLTSGSPINGASSALNGAAAITTNSSNSLSVSANRYVILHAVFIVLKYQSR